MRSRVRGGTAAAVLGALLVAGCGDDGDGTASRAGRGADAAAHPVTVTDCKGAETTFRKPPEKIVTSNAAALELLLRLGVGDKVIGTGFPPGKGTFPAGLDAQAQQVRVLSKTVIPKEKLLGSGADLYIDTFSAMKMGGGMGDAPTEEEFEAAGIEHIYLKSTACAARRSSPMTDLSAVEDDITALGKVTGTEDRAKKLVRGMRKKVDAVQKAVGSTPERERPAYFFFDYDAGTKQPTAVCDKQVGNAVINQAGARNIFADCDGAFKKVGWEDVISRNPEWIQLAVRNRGSEAADEKAFDEARKWLETNPATKGLSAVEKGRFLRIHSERTTIAGVTNADTVEKIAETLHPGKAD
ncbi:ABC transporter substrate-binding protein [Streptomyces sp. NPDC007083]|uniref:ABC transporter substrate-binding protein n=1 Tax=unclassified Streptomyces TaxID=2593676 RepID=UPI0034074CA6